MMENALEKNKGGKEMRVEKSVVLNREGRTGLSEICSQGWGDLNCLSGL